MIELELRRTLLNKKMLSILILGVIVIFFSSFIYLKDYIFFDYSAADLQTPELQQNAKEMVSQALNKYDVWLAGFSWYIFIMPIISALPHATTYIEDIENNMITNINSRINHWKYVCTKIIINAISGGVAVTIPIIMSLIITSLLFTTEIQYFSMYKAFGGIFNDLFKNRIYTYMLIHLGIEFLFGCSYATIALAVSTKIKNSMAILLAPFLFWAGGSVIVELIHLPVSAPMDINQFYVCKNLTLQEILIQLIFIFLVSSLAFIFNTRKEDIYEKRDLL
ncbi:hypothetical protein [uncultured Clostridium sp.]|uniref:hypothetical protein n=1 Tax=uncultured Clostridium sp. TaxID=59620 RepID=UPI0028EA15C5|nr:hypothetical protein [uncultured Clostridium sp.]